MGIGDEIMALGRAEAINEGSGRKVAIMDALGNTQRKHELWLHHPAIAKPEELKTAVKIIDGGGARPYLDSLSGGKSAYNMMHRARAGRVRLLDEERAFNKLKEPYIVIEPNIKKAASVNKQWGFDKWSKVISAMPYPVYQLGSNDERPLAEGARFLKTPELRHALAVIERAALVLTNEGGTHHMAASMRRPAVVVFGGFVPPEVTGYDFHYNIAGHGEACGVWAKCSHCADIMDRITPEMVIEGALKMLGDANAGCIYRA